MLNIPIELQLHIANFLDVETIISLRKTCTSLYQFTHDRSLWLDLLSRTHDIFPQPLSASDSATLSSLQLEHLIKTAIHIERMWLLPRKDPFLITNHDGMEDTSPYIRHLAFVSDRYLLCLASEGRISLWKISDVFTPFAAEVVATFASSTWYPCAYHLNAAGSVLAIALTHVEGLAARMLTISLNTDSFPELSSPRLVTPGEFSILPSQLIRAINVDLEIALLSNMMTSFDIVNWRTKAQATVALRNDDPVEDLWNLMCAMRICGPYVLVFRMHTVEAYPLPPHISSEVGERSDILPLLRCRYPQANYHRASLAKNTCIKDDESEIYGLPMLANDPLHGMFHFHVKLTVRPLPSLSVSLLGIRPMTIASPQLVASQLPENQPDPALLGIARDTRSFVSAWALGDHGRRGVWVGRSRASTNRSVVAFTSPRDVNSVIEGDRMGSNNSLQANEDSEGPMLIDGHLIKTIQSYDLRDDITVCAVSDTTGRIALGARGGSITII
ncbi:hypothetical protein K503DRAFT_859575 [Rhizopogon vinicolor AM-OR11-026]|uniref:F-box domain-containing protein n=1 Tax=Rhizopogon vinicolor AM-OR11-026 TaxID=1314800 RepID=A0A1B7MMG4_9AGAM|nr:hypothetical protein K503DRAFT_859575 [Rhizopogon vinicolor AM-OR11-026]